MHDKSHVSVTILKPDSYSSWRKNASIFAFRTPMSSSLFRSGETCILISLRPASDLWSSLIFRFSLRIGAAGRAAAIRTTSTVGTCAHRMQKAPFIDRGRAGDGSLRHARALLHSSPVVATTLA